MPLYALSSQGVRSSACNVIAGLNLVDYMSREANLDRSHIHAHKHCIRHRAELEASDMCSCFYCLSMYPPNEILKWIDDGQTALCPKCSIDSVIGSASGYSITREFLQRMHDHWF